MSSHPIVASTGSRALTKARSAKQDEFYTQYVDIQKEVEAYLEFDADTFRDKVVYCNCDDPFESNFFKFFAANFNRLGLRKIGFRPSSPTWRRRCKVAIGEGFTRHTTSSHMIRPRSPRS